MHSEMNFDSSGESLPIKGEASNPKRVGSLLRGRPGETMTEGREMESMARGRLIRVAAAHPAGAEGIGTRIPAQEGNYLWFFPSSCVGLGICLGR